MWFATEGVIQSLMYGTSIPEYIFILYICIIDE